MGTESLSRTFKKNAKLDRGAGGRSRGRSIAGDENIDR